MISTNVSWLRKVTAVYRVNICTQKRTELVIGLSFYLTEVFSRFWLEHSSMLNVVNFLPVCLHPARRSLLYILLLLFFYLRARLNVLALCGMMKCYWIELNIELNSTSWVGQSTLTSKCETFLSISFFFPSSHFLLLLLRCCCCCCCCCSCSCCCCCWEKRFEWWMRIVKWFITHTSVSCTHSSWKDPTQPAKKKAKSFHFFHCWLLWRSVCAKS